jgi:hypothetical protein
MAVTNMGKYEPLSDFLRKRREDQVRLTFAEIERIVGFKLPRSAKWYRAWWSNNPSNSVMTKAWLDAGFESEQVDMEGGKLVFRRVRKSVPGTGNSSPPFDKPGQHPLIGSLKGTIWIAPGTNLAEPADPEWGEVAYGDRNWDDQK